MPQLQHRRVWCGHISHCEAVWYDCIPAAFHKISHSIRYRPELLASLREYWVQAHCLSCTSLVCIVAACVASCSFVFDTTLVCYTEKATTAWHHQDQQGRWHKLNHQQTNHAATKQPTNMAFRFSTVWLLPFTLLLLPCCYQTAYEQHFNLYTFTGLVCPQSTGMITAAVTTCDHQQSHGASLPEL